MISTITSSTLSKQAPSQFQSKPSTDPYKSLDGKETSMHGSKIALVSTDQWKNKARTEIKGGTMLEEDVESGMGVPRDAIGVTRDVDVSSMVAK